MTETILGVNIGSSSLKLALYSSKEPPSRQNCILQAAITGVGSRSHLTVRDNSGKCILEKQAAWNSHIAALGVFLDLLKTAFGEFEIVAAGHRVVHGGSRYAGPVEIDAAVLAELRALIPFARLHQPLALNAIEFVAAYFGSLRQVACFDTAFHVTMPKPATTFALPRELREQGLRRYGFHGLSYEYISGALAERGGADVASGRVIVAHLGSGASLCALQGGKSVATTMGLTPLDGLPMGRRSGSVDPGLLLYLLEKDPGSLEQLSLQLHTKSGLLGLSEISDDLQVLLSRNEAAAQEAVDHFVYWVGRHLGSLAAALEGMDALVFTGGIGAHLPEIRARICRNAAWLGVSLDGAANEAGLTRISPAGSKPSAWVIPTDENLIVAKQTFLTLRQSHPT